MYLYGSTGWLACYWATPRGFWPGRVRPTRLLTREVEQRPVIGSENHGGAPRWFGWKGEDRAESLKILREAKRQAAEAAAALAPLPAPPPAVVFCGSISSSSPPAGAAALPAAAANAPAAALLPPLR